ncbi:MAG: glycosyltransferase [Armatimonadetes bacterium]|nr:glycosyltransferase [Armatimonadota bacterium]
MFILYNLVLTLLSPIWVPWMLLRARRRKEAPNWRERSGNYTDAIPAKPKDKERIWVHAVSVGEVVAARPFLRELRRLAPNCEIVLSVTTSSGYQTAKDMEMPPFDYVVYMPIDVPKFTLRAMQRVRPSVVVIMETELWMNFLWAAKVFDAKVLVVNGRMSDRAYRNSVRVKPFYRALFKDVDRCLVQSAVDAERFESLGASRVEVFGNTKFDEAANVVTSVTDDWREKLGIEAGKPVVVVGSTRSEMEEELVVSAFFELKDVVFVHAPRHVETAERIVNLVRSRSSEVRVGQRSKGETGEYLVLDTFGELGSVYSIADVVVIGGGFDRLGGQNLIQPLAMGKPVLHGPNMFNFRDVSAASVQAGASVVCADAASLASSIRELLEDSSRRERMSSAAKALVAANVGASERYADAVVGML